MDWEIQNNRLTKSFTFDNQSRLADFFLKVAKYADKMGHHPDVKVFQCSKMKVELFTHDKQTITELDYELAKEIDLLYF